MVPELAPKIYNLEPIPLKLNARKGARITEREVTHARRWRRQQLLSPDGLKAIEAAVKLGLGDGTNRPSWSAFRGLGSLQGRAWSIKTYLHLNGCVPILVPVSAKNRARRT